MKRILPLLMVVSLLLTGSVTYHHKVDALGNSVIEEKRDLSPILGLFPEHALEDMKTVCSSYSSFDCRVDGTVITMTVKTSPANEYYSLNTDYGIPFSTTTLTISNIPTDLFDGKISDILIKANLTSTKSSTKPIDLSDVSANRARAEAYRKAGIEVNYSVEMPNGEVTSFDLVELFDDSKPITLSSQELNIWVILVIIGVIVVGVLGFNFFGKKRKMLR